MNESTGMILAQDGLDFQPGIIWFDGYENLRRQAIQVAEYLENVEVTEESLKTAKQTLANARKAVRKIDDARKAVKKQIMGNYLQFEAQIKEITGIIDEAETDLAIKTRALDEAEREEKRKAIREIWEKRIWQYPIGAMVNNCFDRWMQPQYLNKTYRLSQVEIEMTDWLEETDRALEALAGMDDEYTVEYIGCLDLTEAITAVNARNELRETVAATKETPSATFTVFGAANIKLVEMLLKEHEIEFTKK